MDTKIKVGKYTLNIDRYCTEKKIKEILENCEVISDD